MESTKNENLHSNYKIHLSSPHTSYHSSPHISPISSLHSHPKSSPNSSPHSSINNSICSYDTLNEQETWKGLKNEPMGPLVSNNKIKRQTKYTNPCPEIDRILNRSRMRSHKNTLIFNGNIAPQCKLKSVTYIVSNTCAFDSVVVAMAVAYNDNYHYKIFIDQTNNKLLNFSRDLAKYGATKSLYKKRVELLQLHFDKNEIYNKVYTINGECNITKIIYGYLKDAPSAIEVISCNECNYEKTRNSASIILKLKNNLNALEENMRNYTSPKYSSCKNCKGTRKSSLTLQPHIFIETDFVESPTKFWDIPQILDEK